MTGFHIISHGERLRKARMPFPTRQVKFLKPTEKKKEKKKEKVNIHSKHPSLRRIRIRDLNTYYKKGKGKHLKNLFLVI